MLGPFSTGEATSGLENSPEPPRGIPMTIPSEDVFLRRLILPP